MSAPKAATEVGSAAARATASRRRAPSLLAVGPLPPPVNGLSKAFSFVVEGLKADGWSVAVVDLADRTRPRVGSTFSWGRLGAVAGVLGQVVRRVRAAEVVYLTISQSRLGFAKDAAIIGAAALLQRPIVVHMHGGNFRGFYEALTPGEQTVVRAALDRVAVIIALTDSLRADFAMTRGWQARTVAVANTCDVRPREPRRAPRSGALRVLYLSTMMVSKGYRDTIIATGELARQRPHLRVHLDLAGSLLAERDFPSPEAQAEDLRQCLGRLPDNVQATYHGEVHGAQKEALLASADVFVLPTSYSNEGQPIAVIEALTAGLPVVATDWRGIRETLPVDMHPLLVPEREPAAVAERLVRLADDPQFYESSSRSAAGHAATFRPAAHLAAVARILEAAVDRKSIP